MAGSLAAAGGGGGGGGGKLIFEEYFNFAKQCNLIGLTC